MAYDAPTDENGNELDPPPGYEFDHETGYWVPEEHSKDDDTPRVAEPQPPQALSAGPSTAPPPASGGGGNEYPGADSDRQGPGGAQEQDNYRVRAAQAAALDAKLGLSPGNLQSFLSGRATYEEYLRDEMARANNYTGNRIGDSQDPRYYDSNGKPTALTLSILAGKTPAPAGTSWFAGGGMGTGGFGAAPAPFGETYSTLARPSALEGMYTPPVWNETFKPPTKDEIEADPGYQVGLDSGMQARQRSAAAQGSILSGGTQKALTRYGTDYGTTKANEVIGRAFDAYKQRYGQFIDTATLGAQARGVNENAYQSDVGNNLTAYQQRANAYQSNINNTRNAEEDYWQRTQDLARNALTAAGLANPR